MNRFFNFLANISVAGKLNIIVAILVLGLSGAFLSGINGLRTNQKFVEASSAQISNSSVTTKQLSELLLRIQTNYDVILNPNIAKAYKESFIETKSNAILEARDIIENYETNILSANNPAISSLSQTSDLANLQEQEYAAFLSLREAFRNFQRTDQQFQEVYESGGRNDVLSSNLNSNLARIQQELISLVEVNNKLANTYHHESALSYQGTVNFLGFALVITVAATWFIANAIMRSISRRLVNLEFFAESVEQNYTDLRYEYEVEGQDEIANLGDTFNRMTIQLRTALIGLEDRVRERTQELEESSKLIERRAEQFESIAQVSRIISSIQGQEELLLRVVHMISQNFGFYHVGIFLLDDAREFAVLRAANSEGGRKMLERGHRLEVGQTGIVGYVTGTGNPRIALDTGADAVFFDNPDLPNTRSEMALPIIINNQIVGALDVQSTEVNAFSQEDINILSTLADQVSIAIQNARLYEEARGALAKAEAANRQLINQAWGEIQRFARVSGYRYDGTKLEPLTNPIDGKQPTDLDDAYFTPVQLRGETIGRLRIKSPVENHQWTEDEISIIRATAERVALAAESARLVTASQKQASKELIIGEISAKIGAAINLDSILQTTLREMGRLLPGAEISIQVENE